MGSLFYRSGWWNGKLCFSKSGTNEMVGFSVIPMNRRELYTLDIIGLNSYGGHSYIETDPSRVFIWYFHVSSKNMDNP